jgi:hypothetical protein
VTDSNETSDADVVVERGLALYFPEHLDLTHQIVPEYDTLKPVVAGWRGDDLIYLISFLKLPPGWLDFEVWFNGFMSEMQLGCEPEGIELVSKDSYGAPGEFSLNAFEA